MSEFIHLHTHSEYSMLMGAARINSILSKAKEYGQNAIALTDHGNMFGMLEFYTAAKKMNIKPIIGCDLYIAPDSRHNREYQPGEDPYHNIILLARNNVGYKNLLKICSAGYLEGFYQKPRIDRQIIQDYSEGLICLTGNYQGELGHSLLNQQEDKAEEIISCYKECFGIENTYLCIQNHGMKEEETVNKLFLELNKYHSFPLLAVNDVHYINPEDSEAHDVLLCIDGGWKFADPSRPRFSSNQYYLRSTEEMVALFGQYPGAITNSVAIAEKCQAEIEFGKLYWPTCPIPAGFLNDHAYLIHLANKGIKNRYTEITEDIQQRLDYELEIMEKMSVSGYMLIVQDFINAAKEMNIPVGPGRGSAVGSLVSYAIGITDVDPLRFNLLFERFLNPERVSMPDIDTDFSDLDRGRIIKYVVEKYGKDSVAQIVTYGRMKAKMVLRDVGRVLGFEAQELNRICKLFPPDKPFADLTESIKSSPELKNVLKENEDTQHLREIAFKLEGLVRQAGMHPAAVIIAPQPVINYAPLFKQPGSDQVMIQYDKQFSEDIGLLKMDFLGLRNLSVIKDCLEEIRKNHKITIDPLSLPESDELTLQLLGKGMTVGVFQFESGGMQEYLRKLKPTGIEDLIAMNALYRPGPIENIPHYIARKNGSEALDCYHPDLEPILGETYGVIVYQEQVMQIAQKLAGFTLGGADEMRRAMAKKKIEKMNKLMPKFINGAKERGYDPKIAENIWNVLVPFSSYAFNKSHSAAYATIAFQTAYLKAHFPSEFLASNMTSEIDDTDRLVILLNDCRELNIKVIEPNVNLSNAKFTSTKGSIVYGLGGIKNVGIGTARQIVAEREKNGPYNTIFDLCQRIDTAVLNRRAVESLIMAGALDELSGNRAQQFASVETAIAIANRIQHDKAIGQTSLFGDIESSSSVTCEDLEHPNVDPWPYNEMLAKEKEVLGLFLSGHPLEPYRMEINAFTSSSLDIGSLERQKTDCEIILGGIITSLRVKLSQKDNRAFAFGMLEDFLGKIEVSFWSDVFENVRDQVEIDSMILIRGKLKKVDDPQRPYKFTADKVLSLEEARAKITQSIHLNLSSPDMQKETIEEIHSYCKAWEGDCQLVLHLNCAGNGFHTILSSVQVRPDAEFTETLGKILGKENVRISSKSVSRY